MWLSGNHRLTIGSIIVITGIAGALLVSAKNSQDAPEPSMHPSGFGTAEKAFDAAGNLVAATDESCDGAGFRKHHRNFGLVTADVRQVSNVGLKLIPVALIGKADNRIEPLRAH